MTTDRFCPNCKSPLKEAGNERFSCPKCKRCFVVLSWRTVHPASFEEINIRMFKKRAVSEIKVDFRLHNGQKKGSKRGRYKQIL